MFKRHLKGEVTIFLVFKNVGLSPALVKIKFGGFHYSLLFCAKKTFVGRVLKTS